MLDDNVKCGNMWQTPRLDFDITYYHGYVWHTSQLLYNSWPTKIENVNTCRVEVMMCLQCEMSLGMSHLSCYWTCCCNTVGSLWVTTSRCRSQYVCLSGLQGLMFNPHDWLCLWKSFLGHQVTGNLTRPTLFMVWWDTAGDTNELHYKTFCYVFVTIFVSDIAGHNCWQFR